MKIWSLLDIVRKNKYNGHEPVTDIASLNNLELETEDKEIKPYPTAPCVIYRNSDRHRIYRDVDVNIIPQDSIGWQYKGEYRHFLGLRRDGTLYTIKPEDAESDNDTPQSLMVILSKMRILVVKSFPLGRDIKKIVKYGIIIVFSFTLVVIIFMIASSLGGSNIPTP